MANQRTSSSSNNNNKMEGRNPKKRARSARINLDVNIESSDEESIHDQDNRDSSSSDDSLNETDLAAKKVRMARDYLERVEKADSSSEEEEEDDGSGDDDDDEEDEKEDANAKLSRRLRQRRMEQAGTLETFVAEKVSNRIQEIRESMAAAKKKTTTTTTTTQMSNPEQQYKDWIAAGHIQPFPRGGAGHDLALTSLALQSDGSRALSGSKDHSVLLWDVETHRKLAVVCPHFGAKQQNQQLHNNSSNTTTSSASARRTAGQVLSVACSDDGRYAAVGTRDALVKIYDIRAPQSQRGKSSSSSSLSSPPSCALIKEFRGHKGPITSLCFQTNSTQLFSASLDRVIRSYNLEEMVQLESLYGHQLGVTSIDCHHQERPVSVGRDRTARVWKLAEDSHMIYRGGSVVSAADCVSIVKNDWFVTGHETGQLALWTTDKKKPVALVHQAHNGTATTTTTMTNNIINNNNHSILSLDVLKQSDLCLTGSNDGFVRLWRIQTGATKNEGRDIIPCGDAGGHEATTIPIHGYVNDLCIGPGAKFALVATGNEHALGRWNPIPRAKNRLVLVRLLSSSSSKNSNNNNNDDA